MRGYREGIGGPGKSQFRWVSTEISIRTPPPPPLEKKLSTSPHPIKCWTPSETLENYCFPKNKPSDPGIGPLCKLLNKLKVRTKKTAKITKNAVRAFYCQVGLDPLPPPPPPPPPPPHPAWRKFLDLHMQMQKTHNTALNTVIYLPCFLL